jgi:hypothetical protein
MPGISAADEPAGAGPSSQAVTPGAIQPIKLGDLILSGSLRTRMESWDWFEGNANNDYTFLGSLLRVSLTQSRANLDWQLELAAPFLLGLPSDAIAAGTQGQLGLGASYFAANSQNTNAGMVFPKQGFLRFKNIGGKEGQAIEVGRMEFIDGAEVAPKNATLAALKRDRIAHRLLGNFSFSDVGRSFDGAQYALSASKTNLTLFGARPTRGVFQVDGWGELNINVFYGALTRQVGSKVNAGEFRVFAVGYSDYRDGVLKTDNRSTAVRKADVSHINIGTYGAHYLQTLSTRSGSFDVLFWGVVQNGSWAYRSNDRGLSPRKQASNRPSPAGCDPGCAPGITMAPATKIPTIPLMGRSSKFCLRRAFMPACPSST